MQLHTYMCTFRHKHALCGHKTCTRNFWLVAATPGGDSQAACSNSCGSWRLRGKTPDRGLRGRSSIPASGNNVLSSLHCLRMVSTVLPKIDPLFMVTGVGKIMYVLLALFRNVSRIMFLFFCTYLFVLVPLLLYEIR